MKVLVIGSGAREHALAWKLNQSPQVEELLVAPGNAGTQQVARNIKIQASDIESLSNFAVQYDVDFTVVGPEVPLADGIADQFHGIGLEIFGPTRAAARIESSKAFAKQLMLDNSIPTAKARIFSTHAGATDYIDRIRPPVVVKADGLAAGKGVVVAHNREDAQKALDDMMVKRIFGVAGDRVVIEEHLEGREVSVFAFVDGEHISPIVAARDYKRAFDGDLGPNTGGMGSYSPPVLIDEELDSRIRSQIMEPTVRALASQGSPYQGMLYAGLILTQEGPKVLEFNCRLGDPEAQVILPRLRGDLLGIMVSTARGSLAGFPVEWDQRACVGIVIASEGYPGEYRTGVTIKGLDRVDPDVMLFHAGTKSTSMSIRTDGGRVLTVVARGRTLDDARSKAYDNAARIAFQGSFHRTDIAAIV